VNKPLKSVMHGTVTQDVWFTVLAVGRLRAHYNP